MSAIRVIDHIPSANPKQKLPAIVWRWGPDWQDARGSGAWVVDRLTNAAMRVKLTEDVAEMPAGEFARELTYWFTGQDIVDDELRALSRVPVAAGGGQVSDGGGVRGSVEAALAELNEQARRQLADVKYPAPADCPPPGSWVRGGYSEPAGKFHHVTGWNGAYGGVAVSCNRIGRNYMINHALYKGRLQVQESPPHDACQRCIEYLRLGHGE